MERWSKWWVALLVVGGWGFAQPAGALDGLSCRAEGGRLVCGAAVGVSSGDSVGGGVRVWSEADLLAALQRAAADSGAWFDVGVLEFMLGRAAESAAAFEFADASLAARVNRGVALVAAGDPRGRPLFEGLLVELTERSFGGGLYGISEPLVMERWDEVTREVVWRFAATALQVGDYGWAYLLLSSFPGGSALVDGWRDARLFAGWVTLPASEFVPVVRSAGLPAWEEALWLGRTFVRDGNVPYASAHYEVVERIAVTEAFVGVADVLAEVSRFWLLAGDSARGVRVAEVAVARDVRGSRNVVASLAVAQHSHGEFVKAADSYRVALGIPGAVGEVEDVRLRFLLAFALEGAGDPAAVQVTADTLAVPSVFESLGERDYASLSLLRASHLREIRLLRSWSRDEESELGALVGRTFGSLSLLTVSELLVLADVADSGLALGALSAAAAIEPASERVRSRLLRQWWNAGQWALVRDALRGWLVDGGNPEWLVLLGGAAVMLDDLVSAEEAWVAAAAANVPGAEGLVALLRGE